MTAFNKGQLIIAPYGDIDLSLLFWIIRVGHMIIPADLRSCAIQ